MSQDTQEAAVEEIRRELEEFGIDAARHVEWSHKMSVIETYVETVTPKGEAYGALELWATEELRDAQIAPEVLSVRLKNVFLMLFGCTVVFLGTVALLWFGYVPDEPYLYVVQVVAFLSAVLILIALLVAMQLLWTAYITERLLRREAMQSLCMARDLLRTAC